MAKFWRADYTCEIHLKVCRVCVNKTKKEGEIVLHCGCKKKKNLFLYFTPQNRTGTLVGSVASVL